MHGNILSYIMHFTSVLKRYSVSLIYTSFETLYSFIHMEKYQWYWSLLRINSSRSSDTHMATNKWVNIGSGNTQKQIWNFQSVNKIYCSDELTVLRAVCELMQLTKCDSSYMLYYCYKPSMYYKANLGIQRNTHNYQLYSWTLSKQLSHVWFKLYL